jgi:hypothetical protein
MLTEFQTYAYMVLCAGDADGIWHGLANPGDNPSLPAPDSPLMAQVAYLTSDKFSLLGILRCDDVIISKGLNVYYGLVLQCTEAFGPFVVGDLLVAVRGTMDALEWLNDALAEIPKAVPGVIGLVSSGFWDIYDSMTFNDPTGALVGDNAPVALAPKLRAWAGQAKTANIYVVGHSLGAALATYLARDLVTQLQGTGLTVRPYMFASPRTGSPDFVSNYQATTPIYSVANYARDLVPNLPTMPPTATLPGGGPTHDVHLIPAKDPNAPPAPNPLRAIELAHNPAWYAFMLDPTNPDAARLKPPN